MYYFYVWKHSEFDKWTDDRTHIPTVIFSLWYVSFRLNDRTVHSPVTKAQVFTITFAKFSPTRFKRSSLICFLTHNIRCPFVCAGLGGGRLLQALEFQVLNLHIYNAGSLMVPYLELRCSYGFPLISKHLMYYSLCANLAESLAIFRNMHKFILVQFHGDRQYDSLFWEIELHNRTKRIALIV